jgi:transposase
MRSLMRNVELMECQISDHVPAWPWGRSRQRSGRGVALINAVPIVAEVGDFSRFSSLRQLMAYLVLVPSSIPAAAQCAGVESQRRAISTRGAP